MFATRSGVSCLLLAAFAPVVAARTQQGLTPEQVVSLRYVTGVHPGPEGLVAFTRSEPRPASEGPGPRRTHLYVLGRDGAERLLVGGRRSVRAVAWRPGAAELGFLDKAEDGTTQVFVVAAAGGEPRRLTRVQGGIRDFAWRPGGAGLAFTRLDPLPEARRKARALGFRQRIVDEDYRNASLWYLDLGTGAERRLTHGDTVMSFRWGPRGERLVAGMAPRNLVDDRYVFTRLRLVTLAGPKVERLVDNPGKLGPYALSPDGSKLAFVGAQDRNDPHAGMVWVADVATRRARLLTRGWRGMAHELAWRRKGGGELVLMAAISEGVRTSIAEISLESGEVTPTLHADGLAFVTFEVGDDGVYVPASTATHPAEVFRLRAGPAGAEVSRRTVSNPWLERVALGRQEVVRFPSSDGLEIEGLLLYPLGYTKGERYPLVIVAHGGPESHFVEGWNTSYARPGQMLCARGWFAWYPNYRSSTGYGVTFAKADHGDPMGREFEDHLQAIAHFAARGLVDRRRVGIVGGSYGGYAAAWAATRHTEHFAAAVSFVPFTDIRTKWLTTDIPYEFYYVHYQERWPHEQPGFLADRSPLTWADRCRTPLLLLGGTADTRVHPSQPFMLYRAVKFATGTPVRYVQYPGEGHGNATNVYRYDFARRSLRWLEWYLRPGDHRKDPPPGIDLDYGAWERLRSPR